MSTKICPKCKTNHEKSGVFCSRACANSRGKRTEDFKNKVRIKAIGRTNSVESKLKELATKGITPIFNQPNNKCIVCGNDTSSPRLKTCSAECLHELRRVNSQSNPNCGGQKHTKRIDITNNMGQTFVSESSYEVKTSEILNQLDIVWIRPSFFWYVDSSGHRRRYYPDFYLPDYDIYLDPKNEYLINTDIEKIYRASEQNEIFVAIIGKNHITQKSISKLVRDRGNAPLLPVCNTGTLLLC